MSAVPTEQATPPGESAPAERVVFTEGSVALPPGYEDRTTNVLVPANVQVQPNLSVARDRMKSGENLSAYVDRQLALLKSQLAGHHLLGRQPARLGTADDTVPEGERIDARYRNGKLTIYQRQAAFELSPGHIVVFTAARAHGFGEEFEQLWAQWLASYRAPGATPPEPAELPASTD